MEYYVFSDESYISAERYRSIGAFSFPGNFIGEINEELVSILSDSDVAEFKWKRLKDAQYRFCALKLSDFVFEHLHQKDIRIDVLIWDTQDSRHKIQGRDDTANFERMFFHLMKNIMTRREKDSEWYVYPDERLDIDWTTIQECLVSTGKWKEVYESRLFGDSFSDRFFNIRDFKPVNSIKTPCCQVADFFAGMGVFSKNKYTKYKKWCEYQDPQGCLFEQPEEVICTKSEKERFKVLEEFVYKCKTTRQGISIKSKECLNTFLPDYPINFWSYMPQHPEDKAPTRN